jgi:hypothetical protein
MTMINLSGYNAIQTNLFLTLDIPNYAVLTFSDYHLPLTLNGVTYQGLGQLISVNQTTNSLRATNQELSIVISGIPAANIPAILSTNMKGSKLNIKRAFFDPKTGLLLNIAGNPTGKFNGVVNNYHIADELPEGSSNGKTTIVISATSILDVLINKIRGRRTNPIDFSSSNDMDRVPLLVNANINFGAPV